MFRSAVLVLVGFTSITAPVEGIFNIIKQGIGGLDDFISVVAPCPQDSGSPHHTYRCAGKSSFSLSHCCSLDEWLLNDGLPYLCVGILVVVAVIMSIFFCKCCSCCPGNRYRHQLVQPIYLDPFAVRVQQHFSESHGTRPAGH